MDINNIWKSQAVPQPDIQALIEKVRVFKARKVRKFWITNLMLLSTSFIIIAIGFWVKPQLITTWIGIGLAVMAMLVFLLAYNRLLPAYKSINSQIDNQLYINKLLHIKQKEMFMSKHMMYIYFVLLSCGIGLYMLEYVKMMSFSSGILIYGITFGWFGFNLFFLHPKAVKKQQAEINEIIEKIKLVSGQFKEDL